MDSDMSMPTRAKVGLFISELAEVEGKIKAANVGVFKIAGTCVWFNMFIRAGPGPGEEDLFDSNEATIMALVVVISADKTDQVISPKVSRTIMHAQ